MALAQSRRRTLAWCLSGLLLAALATVYVFASRPRIDRFRFLRGRGPVHVGVEPRYPTAEYRVYSWESPFGAALPDIDRELRSLGFQVRRGSSSDDFASWSGPGGLKVEAFPGRTSDRRDLARPGSPSAEWTTVVVGSPLPDTWVSHLRLALQPTP